MIDEANKAIDWVDGKQTGLDDKAVSFVVSNADQVHKRVAALREAADAAHALRFVADQTKLEAQLAALLTSLPRIEKPVAPAGVPPVEKSGPAPVDLPRFLPLLKGNQ